jgi:hypothetical protein
VIDDISENYKNIIFKLDTPREIRVRVEAMEIL